MNGIIVKQISNLYTVRCGDQLYGCRARGKFRKDKISPMVGDNVVIDINDNVITDILPRRNELTRPVMSNIDVAFIVTSVKKPNLDLNLLDKLISVITFNDIEPVICFTKLDLLNEKELEEINKLRTYYTYIGIKCVYNTEEVEILKIIKDKTVVLAGQTGAGKSSLLNRIDENLSIEVQEISESLGRGKHTTRHVELIPLLGGYVADTPGFSSLEFIGMTNSDIRDNFIEFNEYKDNCEYKDCMHNNETKCYIKDKVNDGTIIPSRYENYLKFINKK